MPLAIPRLRGIRLTVHRAFALCACVCLAASALAAFGPTRSSASDSSASERSETSAVGGVATPMSADARERALETYGRLPMRFEANRGQAGGGVRFLSRGSGYTLFLTEGGAVLRLRGASGEVPGSTTLKVELDGARPGSRVEGVGRLQGLSNYFVGGSRQSWRTGVPAYEKVRYSSVYPGVDLIYYGTQGQLEYDFRVAPGGDPRRIGLRFEGSSSVRLDEQGDLIIGTESGDVRQLKPVAYQQFGGERRTVAASYTLSEDGRVGFRVDEYDRARPLVIDPVLIYSTYLGGTSFEQGLAVAVDSAGSAYVAGSTGSLDFFGPSPIQNTNGGANDAFVIKLSPDGTSLVYATYLGGGNDDVANAVAVDSAGNAYVAGSTTSDTFPRTQGAWQQSKDGGADGFLAKLNPAGTALVYSTFVGGANSDQVFGLDVDANGRAYVTGRTDSPTFRTLSPGLRGGDAVQKSTDGAAHWSPSDAGMTAATVNGFAVVTTNANVLYAATSNGVFKSIDGGSNWQLTGAGRPSTAPGLTTAVAVDPSNPSVVYAATSFGVSKSTDGGNIYEVKSSGFFIPSITAVVVNPVTPFTVYAGTFFGVYKSLNGGETWVEANNGLGNSPPRVTRLALDPSNSSVVYAATTNGIFKTTNAGANWAAINNGLGSFPPQIQALALDPSNPSTLYVSTLTGPVNVFKSTDGGANWSQGGGINVTVGGQFATPVINALVVDPSAPATLYAGTSSGTGVFKSIDGGASWDATNVGLTSKSVFALALAPNNPSTVYAGTGAGGDAFVARFNAAGSQPDYVKFVGGSENEEARGIVADAAGNAYVAGTTSSENFPVANALQAASGGFADAFVFKLDANGNTFLYSTYLGGLGTDQARAIDIDAAGNAFVTGSTNASNFPVVNALKPNFTGFNADAFVTKLSADGASLVYSTYLGGDSIDQGLAIAVDSAGNACVAGATSSNNDFPILNPVAAFGGSTDAFVTKLNAAGSGVIFSTFLGGFSNDQANAVALDGAGGIYVVGNTTSRNFPLVSPLKSTFNNVSDAFISKIAPSFELSLTMTDAPDPVPFGSDLTYTLAVKNNGELPADGVTLTDTLPVGATLVSTNAGQGSCTGGAPLTCNLGTLGAGASVNVTIVIKPPAVRNITNTASVAANAPDPAPTNNTATAQTLVDFADLSVVKRAAHDLVAPGSRLNYFLTVKNRDGAAAASVTLTDSLPAGTTFVSCGATGGGVCGNSGNNVTVTFPSLAVGTSETVLLSATLDSSVAGGTTVGNTASVNSALPDPLPANNSSTANVTAAVTPILPKANGVIIFASDRAFTGSTQPTGIYTVNPDGTGEKFLPGLPAFFSRPSWSPDGSKLAYSSDNELRVANADGTGSVVVANNVWDFNERISWSPNGAQLAYSGEGVFNKPETIGAINIANVDGSGFSLLPNSPSGLTAADWSPDGTKFVCAGRGPIFVMNLDGSGRQQLTTPPSGGDGQTADTAPRWSPDGTRILFERYSNNYNDVYLMNADGSGLTRLLNIFRTRTPEWSPDGSKLVFESLNELYVINLDGSGLTALTQNHFYNSVPDWQPLPNADPTPTPTPGPTFTIGGRVTNSANGGGILFATMTLTGTRNATIYTDSNGDYLFVNLPAGGNYTVTPSNFSFAFSPAGRTFDNLGANQTGADFVGTFAAANITGHVTDNNGNPLAGIRVNSFGGFPEGSTFTDANGFYSFPNVQRGRTYFITPDPFTPYTFEPRSRTISNLTASTVADFVGTRQPTHVIRGRAVDAATGQGIGGVQINLAQDNNAVTYTFTDSQGNFTFGERQAGYEYGVYATFTQTYLFDPKADAPNPFGQIIIPSLTTDANLTFTGTRQNTVNFSLTAVSVGEGAGQAVLTVTRTGETSLPASVNYSTTDGTASEKSDYTAALGTIRFAAGETTKTFSIFITDDTFVEGTQTFLLHLDGTVGTRLGEADFANVSITDNDSAPSSANPADSTAFFVRQHYRDFLNRDPDADGLAFWTNEIEQCGADAQCREVKRINVSAAFFLSIEFQETGYLAYRFYKAAYGDTTSPNVKGTVPYIRLREFLADAGKIGAGVQVGVGDWERRLDENKAAYAAEFVSRLRFRILFPAGMTADEFVSKLDTQAGGVLSADERAQLVALLGQNPDDEQKRAQVLRRVAEDADLRQRETNRAFVLMEYFGYLRRNPDDPQDTDFRGWSFWLDKLNEHNGDYIAAEMVKAFISADEYRKRFGQ